MADEKKDVKGEEKVLRPESPKKKGNGYFAHVQLIHGDKVIPLGDELPENFPIGAIDRLEKLKQIAKERPPYGGANVPIDKGTDIESMRDAEIKREKK